MIIEFEKLLLILLIVLIFLLIFCDYNLQENVVVRPFSIPNMMPRAMSPSNINRFYGLKEKLFLLREANSSKNVGSIKAKLAEISENNYDPIGRYLKQIFPVTTSIATTPSRNQIRDMKMIIYKNLPEVKLATKILEDNEISVNVRPAFTQ